MTAFGGKPAEQGGSPAGLTGLTGMVGLTGLTNSERDRAALQRR